MLTPSLPLSRSLDLPVCLARFPAARLWLKDESLEDSANLPDPDILAAEIVEDLQAALSQVETRSLPTLAHYFPRSFTFYVAHPIRSIRRDR